MIFLLYLTTLTLIIEGFQVFDFDHGLTRGVILAGIIFLIFAYKKLVRGEIASSLYLTPISKTTVGLFVLLAISNIAFETYRGFDLIYTKRSSWDQPQAMKRAVGWFGAGKNFFSVNVVFDFFILRQAIEENWYQLAECSHDLDVLYKKIPPNREPITISPPQIISASFCDDARRFSTALGFKYGPILPLLYTPFIYIFSEFGVYVGNLVALLMTSVLLYVIADDERRSMGLVSPESVRVALLAAIFPLISPLVATNTLYFGSSDILPTLFGVASLLGLQRERPWLAGVLVGISLGCKLLPGAFFFAVFMLSSTRFIVGALGTFLLAFLPYILLDWRGVFANILLFPFIRLGDNTSFFEALPSSGRVVVVILVALALIVSILKFANEERKGAYSRTRSLMALLISIHLSFYLTTKLLHNNYFVWIIPLLGLIGAIEYRRKVEQGGRECFPRQL